MVNQVLWTVIPAAGVAVAIDVWQNARFGAYMDIVIDLLIYGVLAIAAVWKRLGYTVRAATFPTALFLLGVYLLFRFGIGSFALILLFGAVVFTNVFFSVRGGLAMFALTLLAMFAVAVSIFFGHSQISSSFRDFSFDPGAWIVNTLIYAFLAAATLMTHNTILRSITKSADDAQHLAAELQHQIDGRQYAEESARTARKLTDDVLRGASEVSIIVTDPQGIITLFNSGAERMLGYTADEMVGKQTPFAIHVEAELDEHARSLGIPQGDYRALLDGAHAQLSERKEWTYVRKDGSTLPVSLVVTAIHDENGTRTGLLGIATDITGEREARQALAQRENLYRTLFEAANDAIFIVRDGCFVDCNPVTLTMFGCTREQIIGETPARFSPPAQPDGSESLSRAVAFMSAALDGTPQFFEWRHCRFDGTEFDAEVSLNRLGDGSQGELQGIVRDISARKRTEEEQEKLRAQLLQSQKMEAIGQLAGGIAHDFNNLLHVMSGYLKMAQSEFEPDHPATEPLGYVEQASDRASALVSQLLAFSRRQIIQPENLDMNEVVGQVTVLLSRVLGEHINFEFKPCPEEALINADRAMMEQVIMNLCVNARDAMETYGTLTVATRVIECDDAFCEANPWAVCGPYVHLSVSDTGCGMEPAVLSHMYEPFFSTKDKSKGTGLGLATVYGIVHQHRGAIQAYSEPGTGTTFNVYIPHTGERPDGESTSNNGPAVGGTETILLAEDDESVRTLVTRMLHSAGYTVISATHGAEAVEIFQDQCDTIDAVILDVVMPQLGGRDAYDRIQTIKPGIPALFSSGYSESAIHTNFVLKDGMRLIQKPYSANELLAALRECLDNSTHP